MQLLKKTSLVLMIILYVGAGINHFLHPAGYLSIIPNYLPFHHAINITSGILELIFGVMLIFPATRKAGAIGIVILLICFIPAHVYMITEGGCMKGEQALCIPLWLAWVRLFPLQFILILWAWWTGKVES